MSITNLGTANDPSGSAGFSQITVTATASAGQRVWVTVANNQSVVGPIGTVTDSQGNTYPSIGSIVSSFTGIIFRSLITKSLVAGIDTIKYTAPVGASSAISVSAINGFTGSSGFAPVTGTSATPSVTGTRPGFGVLAIGSVCYLNSTVTASQSPGFSSPPNSIASSSTVPGIISGSLFENTAAIQTYAPTLSSSDDWIAFINEFDPNQQVRPLVLTRYWAQDPSSAIASQTLGTSVALLAPAQPTLIVLPADFGNPLPSVKAIESQALGVFSALLAAPTGRPASFDYDWPVPKGLLPSVSWLQSTPQTLRSILTIPQFNFDWPNPQVSQRNVSLLWNGAATSPALLTQNVNPVIAQYDWPVPMAPKGLQPWTGAGTSPALLTQGSVPTISQYDWPVPIAGKKATDSQALGASSALLAAQAPSSKDQIRGPVFTRLWTTDPSAAINSQIQQNLEALYQPVVTPIATQPRKPFYTRHWPRDSYTSITSQPQSTPTTLLLTQVPPPFNYDWPVPRGYLWNGSSVYVAAWGTASNLITPTGAPFLNYDWPNPKGPAPTPRWEVSGIPTGLLTPINIPAIAQYDWPVPKGYDRGVGNLWGLWGTPASIITPTGIPASFNYDWPVPKGAAPTPRWEVANSPVALLAQIRAFAQYDWPNPQGPLRSVGLIWNGAGTSPLLLTQNTNPVIAQYDWPVPQAPLRSSFLLWNGQSTPTNFLPVINIAQYDWPVPKGPQGSVYLLWNGASTPSALLTQNSIPIIAQYDWPVPQAPLRSAYLLWNGPGPPGTIPVTVPPTLSVNYDWPNPGIAKANVGLLTIDTEGVNPNLFPPATRPPFVPMIMRLGRQSHTIRR